MTPEEREVAMLISELRELKEKVKSTGKTELCEHIDYGILHLKYCAFPTSSKRKAREIIVLCNDFFKANRPKMKRPKVVTFFNRVEIFE